MKKQFYIILCLVIYVSCSSRDVYMWEHTDYLCPSWISSDRILIIEHYEYMRIAEDGWGNVVEYEILSHKLTMCEIDLSGNIVKKSSIIEENNAPMNYSVNNTSVAGDYIFIGMRISHEVDCFEMFRINRDNTGLVNLGLGYKPEPSNEGSRIVYNKFSIENYNWKNHGLWIKNVDGSGDVCLVDSVTYGAWGPDNLIAYCWYDTLFIIDTSGTIRHSWYAGEGAHHPDWSSSPDTVLVSTGSNPRLVAIADGSNFVLPLNLGWDVCWSPDGSRFIFRAFDWVDMKTYHYVINRDGSDKIRLHWD